MKRTITKEFQWECAHRLYNPKKTEEENKKIFGDCFNIHGHTYKMFVTISTKVGTRNGMIINFKDLKKIVKREIIDIQDHSLNLTIGDPLIKILKSQTQLKINLWTNETTCENQIITFWAALKRQFLKLGIILEEIKLYETPTSFASMTR